MVPFSERRHRIHGEEIPEVIEGLRLRLRQHLKTREDLSGATIAFMVLYRLVTHQAGRPEYPEPVTWSLIESWIMVPLSGSGDEPIEAETMNRFEKEKENAPETFQATPIHESLKEDLAKCSACSKDVPRTLYCINCGAPIEAEKEPEDPSPDAGEGEEAGQ